MIVKKDTNEKRPTFHYFSYSLDQKSKRWSYKFYHIPVQAIDNFVYMMTSLKWRPGTILKKLYSPQNFVPAFLSTVVWFLESQSPGKRTDRASIQSNQKWRRIKCVEEFCIRSRTAAPKLSSDSLTCYEAKGNLR